MELSIYSVKKDFRICATLSIQRDNLKKTDQNTNKNWWR